MKKVITLLVAFIATILLVSCKPDNPEGNKEKIVIMHGATHEVDPRHTAFSGTQKAARLALLEAVEDELNVEVEYRMYPSNAAWGPTRVTAIVQASVNSTPLADIYWVTNDWISSLVDGNAIVSLDQYKETDLVNLHSSFLDIGTFKGSLYGFESGKSVADIGLYYNADLVSTLGVDNPTDLFLEGKWTWSVFESWARQVQTALGEEGTAIGSTPAAWAEGMIPLNGGSLVSKTRQQVTFAQNPAIETYNFIQKLYKAGIWEINGGMDSGSPEWQAGKVAIHPGRFWFLNADNRWKNLQFELGFVPFPKSDTYTGEYVSPVSGVAIYSLASGMTPEREALVMKVWSRLQLWKTDAELDEEFELTLSSRFDKQSYVDAYLSVYDKVYVELINALGISTFLDSGWTKNVNGGIKETDGQSIRGNLDAILQVYQNAAKEYFE